MSANLKFQLGDRVKVNHLLTNDELDLIYKLNGRHLSADAEKYLRAKYTTVEHFKAATLSVTNCGVTPKTQTSFVTVAINRPGVAAAYALIQARYINLSFRQNKHPLTDMFVFYEKSS